MVVIFFFVSLTNEHQAASLADSSPASVSLPLRVEPKPRSGIRQQDLLRKVVEVKPKRPKVSDHSDGCRSTPTSVNYSSSSIKSTAEAKQSKVIRADEVKQEKDVDYKNELANPVRSLLGIAYASSDDEDD